MKKAVSSPVTAFILLLLREKQASSTEIADALGTFPSMVTPYLRFLHKKGFIARNSFVWQLTPEGKSFVETHYNHLTFILKSKYGIKMNKDELKRINKNKDFVSEYRTIIQQIKEQACKEGVEECTRILEFLVEHRLKTGGKYWFPSSNHLLSADLAEACGCSSFDVERCIPLLVSKAFIYITRDSLTGLIKVRLHRRFDKLFSNNY